MLKKRKMREKKGNERANKAKEEEQQREAKLAEERVEAEARAAAARAVEEAEQARVAREAQRREEEAARRVLQQARRERQDRLAVMQAALAAHDEKVGGCGCDVIRMGSCGVEEAQGSALLHYTPFHSPSISHSLYAYMNQVTAVQKKLKGLRKKLRDIADLEAKKDQGEKLSAEQKEKVGRRYTLSTHPINAHPINIHITQLFSKPT